MTVNIFIHPNEQVGYVWNAADWQKLRKEFRIVGLLTGSLSNFPRQDTFSSLPLCLSPEEVTLLKEKQLARLVLCPSLLNRPDDEIRKRFCGREAEFQETQKQSYLRRKETEVTRSLKTIIKGKTKEETNDHSSIADHKKLISQEVDKIQSVYVGNYVETSVADPWINETELISVDWTYPNTEQERLKFYVFKDLWERNYYTTSGAKFGGDFLCYLGDPMKFHASFIVVCKGADVIISAKDFIVTGRIGSYTKKTFVFASRIHDSIVYQSLQWAGNPKDELCSSLEEHPSGAAEDR